MLTFTRTLRFKLAIVFSVVMVLMQGTLVFVLPWARETVALQQSDALLAEKANSLAQFVASTIAAGRDLKRDDLRGILERNYPGRLYAQVRTGDQRIPTATKGLEEVLLPFATTEEQGWASDRPGNSFFTTARLPALGSNARGEPPSVRIVTVRMSGGRSGGVYVQVAAPLTELDAAGELVRTGLLWAGLGGTVVAGLLGWLVGALVIDKADKVRSAVRAISAERLGERVDLPGGEDEIGQMSVEVNKMLKRVANAFLAHERFISHVSHELKTPVAALLAEAQALRLSKSGEAHYRTFAESVEDEMRRLGKLVESFLMLARFGHGKRFVANTRMPINEIVMNCVAHSALFAQQQGVAILPTLHDPGSSSGDGMVEGLVRGDAELLGVAVDNLIRNAIQHSPRGGSVNIRVECDHQWAKVEVRDQGPGIPPEYLQRIFDKFAQVPRDERNHRGTGLGLTIAKGVIDLHDGRIEVRNVIEGGTAFTIWLPLAEATGSRLLPGVIPPETPSREPARDSRPTPTPLPTGRPSPAGS